MNPPTVIWLDMQLPPAFCGRISEQTGLSCQHLAELGMDRTVDEDVFQAARRAGAVVITKDVDFSRLLQRHGPPPSVVWLRCGNCSVSALGALLDTFLAPALDMIRGGEPLVEIVGLPPGPPGAV
ncbi:MAG: hypothetical protein EA376_03240 [Phycisphaeraceae bacterium]|nr:MAG: hypothetical protein EA376_03240 [Phycisphaeraceae bacterium]